MATLLTLSNLIGGGFVSIGGQDGVEVYQRKDSAAIELAAVGEIDEPPAEVQAALLDYGAHTRVTARLSESRVIVRQAGTQLVYQYLKLPVIKDRDYTLRVSWREDAPRGLRFFIDNEQGPAPTSKTVRLNTLSGKWDLEPIRDGNSTRATYHVTIDLGGSVPRWMVRGGAAKDLPNLYLGIRKLVVARRAGQVGAVSNR